MSSGMEGDNEVRWGSFYHKRKLPWGGKPHTKGHTLDETMQNGQIQRDGVRVGGWQSQRVRGTERTV